MKDYPDRSYPRSEAVPGLNRRRLVGLYTWEWEGITYTIEYGFTWNGASIPRPLRGIISPYAVRVDRAALIHDWLYRDKRLPRDQCDEIFRAFLLEDGVAPWLAGAMYRAVRIGGGNAYRTGVDG